MPPGILYNCRELENTCSSCLGRNRLGFDCGWCSNSECTVSEECSATFSITTDACPAPVINSIQPNRGPREGGTRVTITGTDLGASFSDILQVRLVSETGTSGSCNLAGEEQYVLGREIVCDTVRVATTSIHMMDVHVRRESNVEVVSVPFSVDEPHLNGVHPQFGPKSGGIEVTLSGRSLAIGNTDQTRVELNGVNCTIQE